MPRLTKRYKKKVDVTVRMPLSVRSLAKRTVALLGDELVEVPGTSELVKPSIAVLALRGLADECNKIQAEAQKRREAVAECRRRGVKPKFGDAKRRLT